MKRRLLIGTAALAIVAGAAWPRGGALVLSDADGAALRSLPVSPGDSFAILFTHSVAKSPVEEIFFITGPDEFTLRETRYEDFGWGLPHEELPGQRMEFGDGKVRLTGYDVKFKDLRLRVGHIADHRLVMGDGRVVRLAEVQRPGGEVRLTVEKRLWWQ